MNRSGRKTITASFIILATMGLALADPSANNPKVAEPPASVASDGRVYTHDKAWKADEIHLEVNLDNDPEPEIFIGFIGTWRPETSAPDTPQDPLAFVKREIPIVEHRVFYQILDPRSEGRTRAVPI
jgi:hypothetical protein